MMVAITVTWNERGDGRVCGKCLLLGGYQWNFREELPALLVHPLFGVVWDFMVDESRAHGERSYNCRCFLTYEFDDSDVTQLLNDVIKDKHEFEDNLAIVIDYVQLYRSIR